MVQAGVDVEQTTRAWLALTDRGDAATSWEHASSLFQHAVTAEQWGQALRPAREPLGPLVERTLVAAKPTTALPGAPDGEYVVLTFRSSFAHKQSAIETVTSMRDADGSWRVSGYFIR